MKKTTILLALIAVLAMSIPALAAAPELRGTWKGTALLNMPDGAREGVVAYVIDSQEENQFRGYKLWFNRDKVLQREVLVGIYDQGRLYFAEQNDGHGFGYLTGKQSMTVNYIEGGALAKTMIYTLQRVHFTTGFVEIDKDGDNMVMRAEISTHYPLNAERIIKEADTDNDGKLTMKEWDSWRQKNDWK